jgi:uncharacterized membrane protein
MKLTPLKNSQLLDNKAIWEYNTRMKKEPVFYLKWLATFVTIVGAVFTSINMYPEGPILLNIGSFLWLIVSIIWKEWSLIVINTVLLLVYTGGLLVKLFS